MPEDDPAKTRRAATPRRNDGKRDGEPTPQGFKAAGPGNRHGVAPRNSPGDAGLDLEPFHPDAGRPAKDPEATAQRVLDQARSGKPAQGDAGPLAAGQTRAADHDGKA